MSADSIFSLANGLVALPGSPRFGNAGSAGGSGGGGGGGGDSPPPAEEPPSADGAGLGGLPAFSMPAPPTPGGVTNNPVAASYSASSAVLNWSPPPAASAPSYGSPEAPSGQVSVSTPAPPLDYPQVSAPPATGSAGLVGIQKPSIAIGSRPTLLNPTLADFSVSSIRPFDDPLPSYSSISVSPLGAPGRLNYTADAALIERMRVTLQGSDVLTEAIQDAIYATLTSELDSKELFGLQQVMSGSAARGFSMPTGAANRQVAELLNEIRAAREDASFKVRDETYERAKNLLLETTSKAMAHEAKRFELHLRYGKKLVQTLQFNVKAAKALFDATVDLFNTKAALVNELVGNYRAYVRAVEAQGDAKVAQVRLALGDALKFNYESEMYAAQIGTARAMAEVESISAKDQALVLAEYEAYLIGALSQVDAVKTNVESFREAIRAMGKAIEAEGAKFDAQAEQVRAAGSMTGVWEANVNAYAGFWRAEGDRTSAFNSYIQETGRLLDAQVSEFREYAGAHRSFVQAQTAKVEAQASAVSAWSRAIRAGSSYTSAYNKAEAERAGAVNMQSMGRAASSMNKQALAASEAAFEARQKAAELASNATIAAGLAQSALGVIGASVGITGNASSDKGASRRGSTSFSHNGARSWTNTRSHSRDG